MVFSSEKADKVAVYKTDKFKYFSSNYTNQIYCWLFIKACWQKPIQKVQLS